MVHVAPVKIIIGKKKKKTPFHSLELDVSEGFGFFIILGWSHISILKDHTSQKLVLS